MKNIAPSDPSLRYTGRIDFTNSDAPTLINAGSSIHARFSGTSVGFRAINHHNYFENSMGFLVDGIEGKAVLRNDSEPHDYPIASGLADGTHELILWKRSDGGLSYADFLGLLVDDGAKVTSAGERPTRRIECFGDSVSAGEVAEALAETSPACLRVELVQVAAVCVQWLGALGRRQCDAARALFGDQTCPACGMEHPSQPCPQPDLFGGSDA